jgi:hypothetical protein
VKKAIREIRVHLAQTAFLVILVLKVIRVRLAHRGSKEFKESRA